MRTYRSIWRTIVAVLGTVSLLAAVASSGWLAVLGPAILMSVTGAVISFSLIEGPNRHWRARADVAFWFGAGTVLLLGLPVVLGLWSLLVLVGIGGLCPPLVQEVARQSRQRRPVPTVRDCQRLSDRDLQERWLRTSQELRDRCADVVAVLALVEERSILLDELERRDPPGFAALLVRAGWRQPQDH